MKSVKKTNVYSAQRSIRNIVNLSESMSFLDMPDVRNFWASGVGFNNINKIMSTQRMSN